MGLRRDNDTLNRVFLVRKFDPATSQIIEASGTFTPARARLVDRTVTTLKQSGAWAALDALWVLAAHDSGSALINWKNPGTFNLTLTNTPTFVANRGFTGNGTDSCLTGPNLSSFGGMFALNSAHMGVFVGTNVSENLADIGSVNSMIRTRAATDTMTTRANDGTTVNNVGISSTSIGHSMWNRTASTAYDVYRNNAVVASQTTTTTSIANATMQVCAGGGSFGTKQISAGHVGLQMAATARAGMYSALLTWMTAVGAPTA